MTRRKLFFFFCCSSLRQDAAAGGDVQTNLHSAEGKGEREKKTPIFVNQQAEKKKREIFYFFVSQKTNTLDAHI